MPDTNTNDLRTAGGVAVSAPAGAAVRLAQLAPGSEREGAEGTMLVVDDDGTSRVILSAVARQAGYRVVQATDGVEALQAFGQHHPDVVLLDVNMPRMDGFETCQQIRRMAIGQHVPIIMVTGMDDLGSINHAYESGATDFVSKPIKAELLRHRVRYVHRSSKTTKGLLRAQTRHRAIVAAMPDAMLRMDATGRIIEFENEWVAERLGLSRLRLGRRVHDVLSEPQAQEFVQAIERALRTEALHHAEFRLSGPRQHWDYEARIAMSGPDEVFVIVRDITERKASEAAMQRLAYQDPLTGAANRQSFMEVLAREMDRATATATTLAVLFLDLDGFKGVNDRHGHAVGDRVLRGAVERIRQAVRAVDLVARLGGDEFTVLLTDAHDLQQVQTVATRIIDAVGAPFAVDGFRLNISVSVGVALFPGGGANDPAGLLACADEAMYQAKQDGKNRYWVHRPPGVR